MGDNAIIPLPSRDLGQTDLRNILSVVHIEDNGFYKLGTKERIVTQCYTEINLKQ